MSYLSAASASRSSPKSESGFFGPSTLAHNAPLRSNFDNDTTMPGRRPPSRRSQRGVPSPLKAAAILGAFLPMPPVLSIIYVVCGAVILRAAHLAHFAVPLISSVRAAAVGGVILDLPLAVLLYLLLFPTKPPDPAEDFFEDEEDTGRLWLTYGTYTLCAVLVLTLGAISGALGTVCLPSNIMLSAAEAAEAGIVGGAVTCGGVAILAVFAFLVWWDFFRPKRPTTE